MRIGYLLQDMPALYGAERATLDLLRGLTAAGGVEPVVLLILESRLSESPMAFGQALMALGVPLQIFRVQGPFSLSLLLQIRRAVDTYHLQAVHAVGPKADLHLILARGRFKRISTLHGWLFRHERKERLHEWIDAQCLRRMDRVVVLSSFYHKLLENQELPGKSIRHIPTGFDVQGLDFQERACPPKLRIGWGGRLSSEKNPGLLLAGVHQFREQGGSFKLRIAGEGPEEGFIRREIVRLGLSKEVELSGFLPRQDLLKDLDVLVLTSSIENLPYMLMEAMAVGLPIIATRVGGIPDLVEDGITGRLIDPGDMVGLASALAFIVDHPQEVRAQCRAGRVKLEQEFNPRTALTAHQALYGEVTGEA